MNETKTKYYLGGYYLLKLRPKKYGQNSESLIYTCSECFNDNILDTWSYSWTTDNNKNLDEIKSSYQLSSIRIEEIRNWVDKKFDDNQIGFLNVFFDIETALDYKKRFFPHLTDIGIFALYFNPKEREDILHEFKPESEKQGEIGLRLALLKETEEQESEELLGYDYIGIEIGGSFHTFHCHNIGKELSDKFDLTLNEYGLFNSDKNSKQVLDYLNKEENGFESVPWFIVKTKLVKNE